MQRALTNNLTLGINYVGNQSHHLINSTNAGGGARGYWSNQLNPIYLAGLGNQVGTGNVPLLSAPATPANVAKARLRCRESAFRSSSDGRSRRR